MGSSKKQTVGYKYHLGMHQILIHGPADKMTRYTVDERLAWSGSSTGGQISVNAPSLFGGEAREGGVSGVMDLEMGGPSQGSNSYLAGMLGGVIPAFRGVVGIVMRQMYLGNNPYLKKNAFRLQRIHIRQDGVEQWYDEKAEIAGITAKGGVYSFDAKTAHQTPGYNSSEAFVTLASGESIRLEMYGSASSAYSLWASDAGVPVGRKPWRFTLNVSKDGAVPVSYYPEEFNTPEEAAAAAALQGPITLVGPGTFSVYLWDGDTEAYNNRGSATFGIGLTDSNDMNPAHMIRECLTDPIWGMGYNEEDIDDESFTAAADQLFAESMGMSLLWDRQMPIEQFVQEIIKHINAALYVGRYGPPAGKFVLRLIRGDYNIEDLPVFDESSIEKVENFKRVETGELVNSVTVNYWDSKTGKTASTTAQDPALVQQQGAVINTAMQYTGFTNQPIADRAALRDLGSLSTPLASCTLYLKPKDDPDDTRPDPNLLNIGDVIAVNWDDYGLILLPMRISALTLGDGKTHRVKAVVTQDVFTLPLQGMITPPDVGWEDPNQEPIPMDRHYSEEAPYYEIVQQLSQSVVDTQLATEPDMGLIAGAGSRPQAGAINARFMVDEGSGFEDVGAIDFCASGVLAVAVGKNTTIWQLEGGVDLNIIELGTYAKIGEEYVVVDAVLGNALVVQRAALDTLPHTHGIGEVVFFSDPFIQLGPVEYVASDEVDAKYLTVTGSGISDIGLAGADTVVFGSRAIRPYPPGNFKINGQYFPETIGSDEGLDLTWSHRDRLQQTGGALVGFTDGDVGPEPGVAYTLRIYDDVGDLLHEEVGLVEGGFEYTLSDELSDMGTPEEDPHWAGVKLLLNMNGSDGSTSFIDSSASPKTVTVFGNAHIEDSQSKFGGSSGQFDGSGDYLTLPAGDSDFNLGSGDFTIDGWVRRPAAGGSPQHVIGFWDGAGLQSWHMNVNNLGRISFEYSLTGSYDASRSTGTTLNVTPLDTWVFFEWNRSGSTMRIFANGIQVHSFNCGSDTIHFNAGATLKIGANSNGQGLNAFLQDLRFTKGAARNVANYQPPAFQAGQYIPGPGARLNGKLRVELLAERGGYESWQKYDHEVRRFGYGFNYGESYGDKAGFGAFYGQSYGV